MKKNKTIPVPFPVDADAIDRVREGDWTANNQYIDDILNRAKPKKVYLDDIIATQLSVDKDYVDMLIKTGKYKTGENGEREVGFAYHFPDDPAHFFIIDGHHRATAAKIVGKKSVILFVAELTDEDLLYEEIVPKKEMKITKHSLTDIIDDTDLISQLKKLTKRGESGMLDLLNRAELFPNVRKGVVVSIAWDKNIPVGWAFSDFVHRSKDFWKRNLKSRGEPQDIYNIGVYVMPKYRQQGIGSLLISNIKKELDPRLIKTYPYDKKGKLFFAKQNLNEVFKEYIGHIIQEVLDEDKFQDAIKEIPELSREAFKKHFQGIKPKYLPWIIKMMVNYPWRDRDNQFGRLRKDIDQFDILITKGKIEEKDINQYTWQQLHDTNEKALTPTETELRKAAKSQATKIYEDENYLLIQPQSTEASQYYGKGTKWCISGLKDNRFKAYTDEDNEFIFIINKKTNDKHALVFKNAQLTQSYNTEDDSIDKTELLRAYPLDLLKKINEFYGKEIFNPIPEEAKELLSKIDAQASIIEGEKEELLKGETSSYERALVQAACNTARLVLDFIETPGVKEEALMAIEAAELWTKDPSKMTDSSLYRKARFIDAEKEYSTAEWYAAYAAEDAVIAAAKGYSWRELYAQTRGAITDAKHAVYLKYGI